MLEFITTTNHKILNYIKDDPVRPEIEPELRISANRMISAIIVDNKPLAITCVSFNNTIPKNVEEMMCPVNDPHIAVFYTIWSYTKGSGRDLLINSVKNIITEYPTIMKFVTLSPKTDMARKFHLANGATVYRENETSVNYEYTPK
jgi:hypothetical protein